MENLITKDNFLIYGSYGYSGNLIAELAVKQGLKPILSGRNKEKLIEQANRLGLEYRVFDVKDFEATKEAIQDVVTVIHCAGPFINTFQNMVKACLETRTHYTDITGEYGVIEKLMELNNQAVAAEIMLLPGAGFDVVPSDCLAQYLKSKLPDATQLTLAIHVSKDRTEPSTSVSRGTAKTMVENLGEGSMMRDKGRLTPIPFGWHARDFNFGNNKPVFCTTIAWGDIASAWWSTKIPHIETYMAASRRLLKWYKFLNPIKSLFKWKPIKNLLQSRIDKLPEGPSDLELEKATAHVYGEVANPAGEKVAALVHTPNGYKLTALTAVLIIQKILAGHAPIGFQTPSTAYSKDLILEVPGTSRVDV